MTIDCSLYSKHTEIMKSTLQIILILIITSASFGQTGVDASEVQNTWTYTYLKAKEGQQENLKQYLFRNWFVMDSIAVARGLFNDFQLLENSNTSVDVEWDFIVAVEYYTKGTYADIQDEWTEIRANHRNVNVEGYSFPELATIVKSETLTVAPKSKLPTCQGPEYEILQPFIGRWQEYLIKEEAEELYGALSLEVSPGNCSLTKEFSMLTSSFSYTTLGYFDARSETWKETYSFSNGEYAIYEWKKEEGEVVMELLSSSFPAEGRRKNRWTNVTEDSFQIIAEKSNDGGETWEVSSITQLRRIGK